MPYISFKSIESKIDNWASYTIKILAKSNCIALKATCSKDLKKTGTLEEYDGTEALPNETHEVIVHCMSS